MDIGALQKLFEDTAPADGDDYTPSGGSGKPSVMSPADLVPRAPAPAPAPPPKVKDPKSIWDEEEVTTLEDADDPSDPRKRPEFEITYLQDVRTEDMYLGSSDKDPSSTSCDRIVVHIKLPRVNIAEVDLNVTKQKIVVQSPEYKLSTYLPYPVKDKDGKAKWDQAKQELVVTLPIIRKDPFS